MPLNPPGVLPFCWPSLRVPFGARSSQGEAAVPRSVSAICGRELAPVR
jgi:hypothetical protein